MDFISKSLLHLHCQSRFCPSLQIMFLHLCQNILLTLSLTFLCGLREMFNFPHLSSQGGLKPLPSSQMSSNMFTTGTWQEPENRWKPHRKKTGATQWLRRGRRKNVMLRETERGGGHPYASERAKMWCYMVWMRYVHYANLKLTCLANWRRLINVWLYLPSMSNKEHVRGKKY